MVLEGSPAGSTAQKRVLKRGKSFGKPQAMTSSSSCQCLFPTTAPKDSFSDWTMLLDIPNLNRMVGLLIVSRRYMKSVSMCSWFLIFFIMVTVILDNCLFLTDCVQVWLTNIWNQPIYDSEQGKSFFICQKLETGPLFTYTLASQWDTLHSVMSVKDKKNLLYIWQGFFCLFFFKPGEI